MPKIILSNTVREKLRTLIQVLLDKEYFSFETSAIRYVDEIILFIYSINHHQRKYSKNPIHGIFYSRYTVKNNRTSYYITYNIMDEVFFIENIFTNHELDYHLYIR